MTRTVRIGRLDIRLSGVAPETARAALALLPAALAERLGDGPQGAAHAADAGRALARRLADDVARELDRRGRGGGRP